MSRKMSENDRVRRAWEREQKVEVANKMQSLGLEVEYMELMHRRSMAAIRLESRKYKRGLAIIDKKTKKQLDENGRAQKEMMKSLDAEPKNTENESTK